MTPADVDQFIFDLLSAIGQEGLLQASSVIPSDQLRNALVLQFLDDNRTARLYIPHYWAVYVHDGRAAFGPRWARFLVWFRDPLQDPRLNNGLYPERFADVVRLTRDQFYQGLADNRAAIASGNVPPMVVLRDKYFNPLRVKETPPTLFFDNSVGMAGFADRAGRIGSDMFSKFVQDQFSDIMNIKDGAKMDLAISLPSVG